MTFAVIWSADASMDFAATLARADDPAAVREAADLVDYLLRRFARDLGESRAPGYRVWYQDVIGVFYYVDEDAMRVEVLFAGPSRRR